MLERAGWRPFLAERELYDVSRSTPEWSERIDRAIDESCLVLRIDLDEDATQGKNFMMDDTDPETLAELERIGDELAVRFSEELEEFVQLLLSAEKASEVVG